MTLSVEQVVMVVLGLGTVITGLAGTLFRVLIAENGRCQGRVATLEAEAKKAVDAKDAEIAEWKRLLLESLGREKPQ